MGWKLLIRTCIIMGHNQKADLYFKRALKIFPDDEELIFENAILKGILISFLTQCCFWKKFIK